MNRAFLLRHEARFCRVAVLLALLSLPSGVVDQGMAQPPHAATAGELWDRAIRAAEQRDSQTAVRLITEAAAAGLSDPMAYYVRGREQLRLGQVDAAVADFDEYLRLRPAARERLWERGIACYYAGKFQEGADQFAAYQQYDGNDVENAVWQLACRARLVGFEEAQRGVLPVRSDPRVPMMAIYRLFCGQATPDDVLAAATAGQPAEEELKYRLFYAHLYLGLYYEARGQAEAARTHLVTAAEKYRNDHYMWDVARVHAARLQPADRERPAP